jgi:hypothetical protein
VIVSVSYVHKVPDEIPLPSIEVIVGNLEDKLMQKRLTTSESENNLGIYTRELEKARKFVEESNPQIQKITEKYNFFRSLTDYCDDFAELLEEKVTHHVRESNGLANIL